MNRTRLTLAALLIAIPVITWVVGVSAQSFRSGNNVTVPQNKTVNSTLYASGRTLDIAGKVNGDLICAGQNISVTGEVTGDVICAGQTVDISGKVGGDVRLAAQNATLGGDVARNASVVAQTFTQNSSSKVSGDVSAAAQDVTLNGDVARDLAASSSTLTVNGKIGRDVNANVEHLSLGSESRVEGRIVYTSSNKLTKEQGAYVEGSVTQHQPSVNKQQRGLSLKFLAYVMLSMFFTALVLVLLMPQTFHSASNFALTSWSRTLAIGLIASLLAPFIIGLFAATVIGIPLALFLLGAWLLILFLSGVFSAYLVGRLLLRSNANNAIWIMLLGALVLLLLYLVPFLNILVMFLAVWFGAGMILQNLRYSKPRYVTARHTRVVNVKSEEP